MEGKMDIEKDKMVLVHPCIRNYDRTIACGKCKGSSYNRKRIIFSVGGGVYDTQATIIL